MAITAQYAITQKANDRNISGEGLAINAITGVVGGSIGGTFTKGTLKHYTNNLFKKPTTIKNMTGTYFPSLAQRIMILNGEEIAKNVTVSTVIRGVGANIVTNNTPSLDEDVNSCSCSPY